MDDFFLLSPYQFSLKIYRKVYFLVIEVTALRNGFTVKART